MVSSAKYAEQRAVIPNNCKRRDCCAVNVDSACYAKQRFLIFLDARVEIRPPGAGDGSRERGRVAWDRGTIIQSKLYLWSID